MSRRPLVIVIVAILGVACAGVASAQEVQILEAYRQLEDGQKLDEMQRRRQQIELLSATLDATEKSMELMDQSSLIVERVINCGMLVVPDELTSDRLRAASVDVRQATQRVLDSWPAKGAKAALSARKYAKSLDGIESTYNDLNLPPETAKGLAALRLVGESMKLLSDVPVLGMAVEQYGELTVAFSESLRRNYRILAPGAVDGAVLRATQAALIEGWPGLFEPHETQVLLATRWEVPLFCDGNGQDHYIKLGNDWKKVDRDRMTSVVSDWLIAYGKPEASLYSSVKANLEDFFEGPSAEAHWSDPSPRSFYVMATQPGQKVHGLTRAELRKKAEVRLAELTDEREMAKVLEDVPRFREGRIALQDFRDMRSNLRSATRRMGIPLSRHRERILLRESFLDEERVETALRTTAFQLVPGSEDFVWGLDLDPWSMNFWELANHLEDYRTDKAFVTVRVEVRDAAGHRPVPNAEVTLVRAITAGGQSRPQTGPLAVRLVRTNSGGVAEVDVLRGHHYVSAEASGFETHTPGAPRTFMEKPKRPTTLTLTRHLLFEETLGTLRARVVDRETGEPIPGARVRLRRNAQTLGATADAEGAASIESVAFGTWTLSVEAEGYEGRSRDGFEMRPDNPDRSGKMALSRLEQRSSRRARPTRQWPPPPGPWRRRPAGSTCWTSGRARRRRWWITPPTAPPASPAPRPTGSIFPGPGG